MKRIGVDESGKGDYFGYLVIAGVVAGDYEEKILAEIGVKDSKNLSDIKAHQLAAQIRKLCKFNVVKISPEKYNQLYPKFKSLNKLLAWGHARVIENLLEKESVDQVIVDKFGDEKYVKDALLDKGRKVKLVQRVRAEEDMAVAAASIIARDEFLKTLRALSIQIGYKLPKGATHVEEAAKAILEKYDENVLDVIAKRHFKTTKKLLNNK